MLASALPGETKWACLELPAPNETEPAWKVCARLLAAIAFEPLALYGLGGPKLTDPAVLSRRMWLKHFELGLHKLEPLVPFTKVQVWYILGATATLAILTCS